ncbi:hypothetical protein L0F63_007357, partial [Massospora cicadina]
MLTRIVEGFGIEAKTLAVDFSEPVNNVGLSHEHPKSFEEEEEKTIRDILEINVTSTVLVTKAVLPSMVQATSESGLFGLIMMVGSFSGLVPTPYLTTYSPSKAFLQTFAQALGPELEKKRILVTNILPYFVVSKMSKIRKSSFMIPSAESYAKAVLAKIGLMGGTSLPFNCIPYPSHALIGWVLETFGTRQFWINFNRDNMIKTRARALKKMHQADPASESTSVAK